MADRNIDGIRSIEFCSGDGESLGKIDGSNVDKFLAMGDKVKKFERLDEFEIPTKSDFEGRKFLDAPELKKVGKFLIDKYPSDFVHLNEANIKYLWKETGGESGGMATLGKCIRPTGLAEFFANEQEGDLSDKVDYVIWAAADHLRENKANVRTVHALIFHELLHTEWEDGKLLVRSHLFEGFPREIEEFGMWTTGIKKIAEACNTVKDVQQGLFTNN